VVVVHLSVSCVCVCVWSALLAFLLGKEPFLGLFLRWCRQREKIDWQESRKFGPDATPKLAFSLPRTGKVCVTKTNNSVLAGGCGVSLLDCLKLCLQANDELGHLVPANLMAFLKLHHHPYSHLVPGQAQT